MQFTANRWVHPVSLLTEEYKGRPIIPGDIVMPARSIESTSKSNFTSPHRVLVLEVEAKSRQPSVYKGLELSSRVDRTAYIRKAEDGLDARVRHW